MKLYTFDKAPNPQRLKLFMHYKGIDLPTEQITLDGQQFSDEYRAINPASTVPTLVLDDGTVLTDTIAIMHFLDSTYPDKPLFGKTPLEQAQVLGWCHRIFCDGFYAVAEVLRNKGDFFKDRALPGAVKFKQVPALVERGNERINAFWPVMEDHLAEREWIVGDGISQADVDCFAVCNFAGWVKHSIPDDCPRLKSWYERVNAELALPA